MKKYCIIIIEKIDLKNLVRRITLSISIISDKCIKLSLQNFSLVHVITIKIIINIEYRPSYLFAKSLFAKFNYLEYPIEYY